MVSLSNHGGSDIPASHVAAASRGMMSMENTTAQQVQGVSMMAAAMFFLPVMDAIAK
jgi:hypothetical protein